MAKWGMVIDLEKCTGCQACSAACAMENSRLPGENWQHVYFYTQGKYPSVKVNWLPRPCMHCENPPCVEACPVRPEKATYKDPAGGMVLVDWNKCIGCQACVAACPYGARQFTGAKPLLRPDARSVFKGDAKHSWNPPWRIPVSVEDWRRGIGVPPVKAAPQEGVVSKCTFCAHRVSKAPKDTVNLDGNDPKLREFTPACVISCPPNARAFGDLDNPASEVSKLIASRKGVRLLEKLGTGPQVYYLAKSGAPMPAFRPAVKA